MMSAVFGLMHYLGDLEELRDLYNNHYGLNVGDTGHWLDYYSSPIFPVQEQPESDDFYILYNFAESHMPEKWWYVDATLSIYVASNSIELISNISRVIRRELGEYEGSVRRVMSWASANSVDMPSLNWIRYANSDSIMSQSQENGVYGQIITLNLNYVDC